MAWADEITEAAYTAPSGKRITFNYDSGMTRKTPLKTAEDTFPDVDGAKIQSLGLGGKKFPMTAIFSGGNCLKNADSFEELLYERGYGILEHPIYGKHTVVPTGEIERNDDLVTSLNESRVKVTFSETITDKTFPDSKVEAEDSLDAAVSGYEDSAASGFADLIETETIDDKLQLQSVLKTQSGQLFKGMNKIADKISNLQEKMTVLQSLKEFKGKVDSMIGKVDEIAKNAQEIATVLIKTARLPSEIAISVLAKIEGYSSVIKDLISNVKKDPVGAKAVANQYAATSTMIGALVAAMSSGVAKTASRAAGSGLGGGGATQGGASGASQGGSGSSQSASSVSSQGSFTSRAAVLSAADAISAQFELYKEYMDSQTARNVFVETGEGYESLLETVISSVQVLETVSFELPVTRIMKLGKDRQIFELLTELYGAQGFDRMDQFITDNNLTADELVLIPMGREVRYYG